MVDHIPDDINKPISEVLSSGYTYQLNNIFGTKLRVLDGVELISNIIDGYSISELDINATIIGVPHIIVLEDIGGNIDWGIYHQIQPYING